MKTINCAECNVAFTFEENPKYPRKYCMNCSEAKKQQWKQKGSTPEEVVVVDMNGVQPVPKGTPVNLAEKPKTNGFKLTEENIRIGALNATIAMGVSNQNPEFWEIVRNFEEYIRNGN